MNRYCRNPGFYAALNFACVSTVVYRWRGIDFELILHTVYVRLFYAFFYIIKLHMCRYKTGYKLFCIMSYVIRIFCKIKD